MPPQTVAIDEEPLDSRMSDTTRTVYGKASSLGSIGERDAARQVAVADVAARGAPHELRLAHGEGREVVVEEERVLALALVLLDDLRVVGGPERRGDERLGLAAREERGAVGARQDADLRGDRPDLGELAAVEALARPGSSRASGP